MSGRDRLQRALLGEDILGTASQAAATDFLLARLAAAFLPQLSRLPYDQGRVTSPSQTVVPRNSAQQSDNRSSGRRWRDAHEDSVDGSFASAASEI